MSDLRTLTPMILSTTAAVNMQAGAGATVLYTVPTGKVCRVTMAVIRDISASLANGTSFSITNFVQAFSLAAVTGGAGTAYAIVVPVQNVGYTETAAAATISLTITTGATAAATATIDLIGYLT